MTSILQQRGLISGCIRYLHNNQSMTGTSTSSCLVITRRNFAIKMDFDPRKVIGFRRRRRVLGIPSGPFMFNLLLVTALGYSTGKYIFEEPLKEYWKEGGVGQQMLKELREAEAAKKAAESQASATTGSSSSEISK